jgi:hypothetical protein
MQMPEFDYLMNLSREELNGMSVEDCGIYEFMLSRYAYYVQKTANRVSGKLKWAEHNLWIVIGKEASSYGNNYTKFEERQLMVKTNNSVAQELNKIILIEGAKLEELQFISGKINSMSKAMSSMRNSKRKHYDYDRNG